MTFNVEDQLEAAGGFGRFQKLYTFFYCAYPFFIGGMQTLLFVFITISPSSHRACASLGCTPEVALFTCDTEIEPDDKFITTVSEWDLRCDDSKWIPVIGSVYFFGFLAGVVILGRACDAYGRKRTLYMSGILTLCGGLCGPLLAKSYMLNLISRLFAGIGVGGLGISGFILNAEVLGSDSRYILVMTSNTAFALGCLVLPLIAYLIPSWRTLSIFVGLIGAPIVFFPTVESPKWLLTQPDGEKKAYQVIRSIAEFNGNTPLPLQGEHELDSVENFGKQSSELSDTKIASPSIEESSNQYILLFTHRKVRNRTFQMCLSWFACSLGYYGLSLNVSNLGNSVYLSSVLVTLAEFPSFVLVGRMVVNPKFGRKGTMVICQAAAAICCLISGFTDGKIMFVSAMVGKGFVSGAFATLYLYGSELFPTEMRSTCLGVQSMCARVAGMIAPAIPALALITPSLPMVVMAIPCLLSAAGILTTLPDTLDVLMPNSLADIDRPFDTRDQDDRGTPECKKSTYTSPPLNKRSTRRGSPSFQELPVEEDYGGNEGDDNNRNKEVITQSRTSNLKKSSSIISYEMEPSPIIHPLSSPIIPPSSSSSPSSSSCSSPPPELNFAVAPEGGGVLRQEEGRQSDRSSTIRSHDKDFMRFKSFKNMVEAERRMDTHMSMSLENNMNATQAEDYQFVPLSSKIGKPREEKDFPIDVNAYDEQKKSASLVPRPREKLAPVRGNANR